MNARVLGGVGIRRLILLGALLTTGAAGATNAFAQASARASRSDLPVSLPDDLGETALDRGRYAVLIDLDENRLYFKQGETTLWSAPVGTGTAMRVITENEDWDFSTPTGRFEVQYKELDPVWIAPDWYYVENNLPVPAQNHSSRYMKGILGAAAVYISPSLAIHGTDKPELLGQRVSHGCIRLENRYAMRLYNNVQPGTEVIIVGGEEARRSGRVVDLRDGYDPSLASRGSSRATRVDAQYDAWSKAKTPALLEVLDEQLAMEGRARASRSDQPSRWDEVVGLLLGRARGGDDAAIDGLLRASTSLQSPTIQREWGTFLAELYRGSPLRTLEGMSALELRARRAVAELIVTAAATLYHGDLTAPSVPWPTARIPATMVGPDAQRGWSALVAAERDHRNGLTRAQPTQPAQPEQPRAAPRQERERAPAPTPAPDRRTSRRVTRQI